MMRARCILPVLANGALALAQVTTRPATPSWPMWGGSPSRNAVCRDSEVPSAWDLETKKNVRWAARVGSYTYGGPIVVDGKVLVGTNNAARYRDHATHDKGCLLCFDACTGELLWQATHDKLASGPANDWPEQGVASSPYVDGDRVYYVSNRCELVCADLAGFHDDENDGPFTDERHREKQDADFVWILDMIGELGVFPHNLAACAPVGAGELVFVCTGNGVDDEHEAPPAPDAPSFIAVDKRTGKVVWKRNDPGRNILHGQWSSPAYAVIAGTPQAIFGGGDGWCYAFEATTGHPLWKFDLNPKDSKWEPGGTGTRTSIVATPVVDGSRVYLAVGDDPEAANAPGHLYAIDATGAGDITATGAVWHVHTEFGRTISSVVVADDRLYAADLDGYLSCFDAKTGKRHWRHDMEAGVWASPVVIGDRVYLGNTDGDLVVVRHADKLEVVARHDMRHAIYTSPVAVDGTLYVATQRFLYAIGTPPGDATGTAWRQFRGNPQQTGVAGSTLPEKLVQRWRYELGPAAPTTAAIADATVFVGADDGRCVAIELATGTLRWTYEAKAAVESAPTVIGDLAIFGDEAGGLHACDARTGELRWKFGAGDRIISSVNPAGDRIVFGSYDGALYCLRAADGTLVWKYTGVEERIHGTPAITPDGHVVFAACDARMHVVRLADGAAVRTVPLGSVSGASAAIRGSRAFVGTYGGAVLAIDWTTGQVLWRFENTERKQPFLASAAVVDGRVVIGGRDKILRAIDAYSGAPHWAVSLGGTIDSSPVAAGSRVFVGADDGVLYAVDLRTGRTMWRFEAGGAIYASPAVGEGFLVIGTDQGSVFCLGPAR